jgi:hypothetical protein
MPAGTVSFDSPTALYSASRGAVPLIGTTPGDTPLRGVLNAKVNGVASFTLGGMTWYAMPFGLPNAWTNATIGGAALVAAFDAWLAAGKPQDTPTLILGSLPNGGMVPGALDAGGAAVFVCSSATDDGRRPGSIPANFWDTSLIHLVDPSNGGLATPSTLHAAREYYVAAVIGNRGNAAGGTYATGPTTAVSPGVEAVAWALTFGTGGASPGVRLPSLSNLDITSQSGVNSVYFLPSAKYDVVGFRLQVQTVFDGLVHAINDAVSAGVFTLPTGMTAEQWLKTPPSHVCLKVAIRRDDQSWPAYDASPQVERRIAQKNLAIFDMDLASPSPAPNIFWRTFTMGGPLGAMLAMLQANDLELGQNVLSFATTFPPKAARILLAVPRATFKRWLGKGGVKGFEIIERDSRERLRVPFDDHVVLAQRGRQDAIRVPFLGDNALPMAIGVEIDNDRLKPGAVHRVTVEQRTRLPYFGSGKQKRCYDVKETVAGGFSLEFRVQGQSPR